MPYGWLNCDAMGMHSAPPPPPANKKKRNNSVGPTSHVCRGDFLLGAARTFLVLSPDVLCVGSFDNSGLYDYANVCPRTCEDNS